MKPDELDKICCEFAGVEPSWRVRYRGNPLVDKRYPEGYLSSTYGREWAETMMSQQSRYGTPTELVAEYPPVSTSWDAAGRLMDALILKGVLYEADGDGADGYEFQHSISLWYSANIGVEPRKRVDVSAATFPMALALAVAELAKESR